MSRQLRNLLKQNRNLEEKIFYEPRKTDWRKELINSKELSEAFSCLSSRIIENESDELSLLRMLNDLEKLSGRPLAAYEKNALQVVEIIFNYIRQNTSFDPKYIRVLNSLQLAFTRMSLNDLSFLDNPKHIAVKFLDKLIDLGHHFDENAGGLAQYFIQAIILLIDRLANRDRVTNQTFMMASQKLDEYYESFSDKANANIGKILSEVDKASRQEQANQYTKQLISGKTQGEEMPIFLLDFFENQIAPILHQTIATHGVKSKHCQQLLTDMDTLTWSITCPHGDPGYNDRYEADVTMAMKRLYQLFEKNKLLSNYVKEFFIEAEDLHNQKLKGQRVQYDVMIAADIFADEEYENDEPTYWFDEPSSSFFDIESLKEGHWYFLIKDNKQHRCQLLMRNELTQQLVFVNLSGEPVATVDFNDSDFLTKFLQPIDLEEKVEYKHATKALMRELKARLSILKTEYQLLLEQKARDREEQHRMEEKHRKEVQKRIEEEKRLQIQIRQEELRREAERLAEERRLEELDAKQRFHVKGIYRKLKPGAVIAYKKDSGKWVEVSLMLISRTTQRHIFTDNKGNKILEPDKNEVFELIRKERLKVVKEASESSDTLHSLVKQRRQKLSQL